MRRAIACLAMTATLFAPLEARAGAEKVGTTAANFLSVGVGPGILGMGGATLGLGGDLNATTWNAASLGWVKETQLALAHATLTENTSQEWLVAGGRFGGSATRWSLSGLYQAEGEFEGRDASNNPTRNYDIASMAIGAAVAQQVGQNVSIGVGGKWVSEELGVTRGNGFTFDGGLQVRVGMIGFGLAAQNVFGKMDFEGLRYPFPGNIGAGIGINHPSGLRAAVDVNIPDAYYPDVRGGLEWRWKDYVAVRTGYRAELGAPAGEALSGPAFGFGAGLSGVWLDYGYLIASQGDPQHRLGFSFNLKGIPLGIGDPFGQGEMPREFDGPNNTGGTKKDVGKKAEKKTTK